MLRRLLPLISLLLTLRLHAEPNPDWTAAVAPIRIADNLYYVGSRDLASYLITTPAGNILINANLDTSPALIRASVEHLGFHWTDIKIFLNSQAHFDHVGGVVLVAHRTAGHTRGCTTFTLRAHVPGDPAGRLRDIVIVGGVAALPHYRLIDTPGHPASYPGIAADFKHTFATLRVLPCDIYLGAHGLYFGLLSKLERMPKEGPAVFIDAAGYRAFVAQAQQDFEAMLAEQRGPVPKE